MSGRQAAVHARHPPADGTTFAAREHQLVEGVVAFDIKHLSGRLQLVQSAMVEAVPPEGFVCDVLFLGRSIEGDNCLAWVCERDDNEIIENIPGVFT